MRYYEDNECLLASLIQIPSKYRKFRADKDEILNMDHNTTLCCFLFKDLGALRPTTAVVKVFIVKAASLLMPTTSSQEAVIIHIYSCIQTY